MFYRINNNKLTDFADYMYDADCKHTTIVSSEELEKYPNKVIVQDGELILNPNFEAELIKKEREELDRLSLTAADVERAIYRAKGIDFEDIISLVQNNKEIDSKALKIELKANNFYRGNPYVNQIGAILGFTGKQLDEFFKTNDYTKLLSGAAKGESINDSNV